MVLVLLLDPVGCPGWDGAMVSGDCTVIDAEGSESSLMLPSASSASTV